MQPLFNALFWLAVLYTVILVCLEGLTLWLHRTSIRFGLIPLMLFLGALTVILQFNILGSVSLSLPGIQIFLPLASYLILPIVLLGLLAVYVINGSTQSRIVIANIVMITILAAFIQAVPGLQFDSPAGSFLFDRPKGLSLRILFSSAITLVADLVILILVYQSCTNLRRRFPSRLAGGLALLAALWGDALIFPLLFYGGSQSQINNLLTHLAGKTIAAFLLWPILAVYLYRIAPNYPDTAATSSRPVLDIFTTTLQLEARARQHYNILNILTEINQLILRANDRATLLKKTCELLINNRNYQIAWIGLAGKGTQRIAIAAQAGPDEGAPASELFTKPDGLAASVIRTGRALIIEDSDRLPENSAERETLQQSGYHALAIFPMRHAHHNIGVLSVCARRPIVIEPDHTSLLQEMADDLAYALDSLEARQQQTILQAAADNMQDGLLVADLQGKIIYANAASAGMLNLPTDELAGKNANDLIPPGESEKVFKAYLQALMTRGELDAEFEHRSPDNHPIFSAIRASLVHDEDGTPAYIVLSVTNITQRRLFEHQLLTLNRIITELVQIHDTPDLLNSILQTSEELLGANASGIYLVEPGSKKIIQTLTHNLPETYARRIAEGYQGLPGDTVSRTMQPVYIEDTLAHTEYGERIRFMAEHGVRALLILPILFQREGLGALVTYYKEPHHFDEDDLQLGLTLSHTLAIAIQNVRLYQAEHSQRQLAEALAQAAISLSSSLNIDEVLDLILEQTRRVALCTSVNILLVEGKAAYLARRRGYENIPDSLQATQDIVFPLTLPTLQAMINTGAPVLIPNAEQDPRWIPVDGTRWIQSYAAAPLQVGGQTIGFLNVDSDQPNFFTEETTQRLQAFAAHAAVAIQNARLFQQLQQYANELEQRVRQRTAELQAAKEGIEGILASVPDAVFVLDDQGQLLQANQAGSELLETAHANHIELFAPDFLTNLTGSAAATEAAILQVETRAFQGRASRLPIDSFHSGLVIAFRDVTRFQELDRMKSRFVSDVSHELRTPLTNLTLYLDLLSSTDNETRRLSYIETLRRETGRLTHLIEDLLTISRLEAGRIQINIKPTDVNRLISEITFDRSLMASGRGLTLLGKPGSNLPLAQADSHLLNQSLSNLLTNAINYTPQGGSVRIASAVAVEDNFTWVTISVSDTGVGIPPEEMPRIFERFYRGSASRETGAPGTGLGLAISREIIDRMGGRITVESIPGSGSTFTLWLKPDGAG